VLHERTYAKVSRHADGLQNFGQAEEVVDAGVARSKVVGARLGSALAEGTGESGDVDRLFLGQHLNAFADVGRVAGGGEGGGRELLEAIAVEGSLEVLESQSCARTLKGRVEEGINAP
jgi:hypothetical protein